MTLSLEDARYHHGLAGGWKSPLKATEADNAALLRDLGVRTTIVRSSGAPDNFAVPEKSCGLQSRLDGAQFLECWIDEVRHSERAEA